MIWIITLIVGATLLGLSLMLTPAGRGEKAQTLRRLLRGLGSLNLALALAVAIPGLIWFFFPSTAQAAGLGQQASADPYASLAAAIAVGLGSIGAGYAVSGTGAAAIGVIAEKPEAFGRVLIFVGLAEGIAIYGLIVAFMVLGR